ncbi:PAS domain S-box protein [Geomonas sp.]|uniref:PAS domain S-box protein n=1 Tax=Geomonas sp. TaxID=2651584 RepID=UPI002B464D20|nr:PAS domain S-box protein [Geomonas sp.]HJV36742.1 PAS domain S-box protein [Geomonas sp.]
MTSPSAASCDPAGSRRAGISIASLLRRLVLLCVAPPVLLASFFAWREVRDDQLGRDQEALRLATNFATAIDQSLDSRIRALGMLASSPMADQSARWPELYREALGFKAHFDSNVILVDGRDPTRMLLNTRVPFGSPLPPVPKVRGQGAVPKTLATGKPAVGDTFIGPVAGQRLVAITVPVTRAGRTVYVLGTTLDGAFFQRRLDQVSLPPEWSLSLLDGRGDVIARRSPPGEREAGHRLVARSARAPWSVVLEIPAAAYRRPMLLGAVTVAGGVLLVTLIGLAGGMAVSRYLARAVAGLAGEHGGGDEGIREIAAARRLLEDAATGIRQSEERFRRLFEQASLPLCFVGNDGTLLDRNARFLQLLGYGESELKKVDDWWPLAYPDPEYRAQMQAKWKAALASHASAGGDQGRECRITCKDGQERIMLLSSIVLPDGVLVSFFDVTDRKRAEEALWEAQARALESQAGALEAQRRARIAALNQMEDAVTARRSAEEALAALREREILLNAMGRAAQIGGWDLDLSTGRVHWTEEVARIYELDEAVQAPADLGLGFYHNEARLSIERALHQAIHQGTPFDLELEMVSAKGSPKWIRTICEPSLEKGEVVRLHGALQDVTERKQAEECLLRSEEKFSKAFAANAAAIAITRVGDGVFIEVNDTWVSLLGYSRQEAVGRTIRDRIWPNAADVRRFVEELTLRGSLQGWEQQFYKKSGEPFVARLSARLLDVQGERVVLSTLVDISDLKLAEQEIRTLNTDLERRVEERTAKLVAANEELDAFAYAVSHDLRAPLRAMMGFSQALVEDHRGALQGDAEVYLEQIVAGSRQMGLLIDGLLALSRSGRGALSMAQVDLSKLARRIQLQLERSEPERRVVWEIEPGLCVQGDGRMLESVLQNLLGNAWKYTSREEAPRIRFHAEERDGRRFFCVSDNGAGFSMDHAARLFKPFQRLHRQDEFPGIGIGLATVQRIIQRHNGEIEADAKPGGGATFRFTLPSSAT